MKNKNRICSRKKESENHEMTDKNDDLNIFI